MDEQQFLQTLRSLSLEDGKSYMQEHIAEFSDVSALSVLLEQEALKK